MAHTICGKKDESHFKSHGSGGFWFLKGQDDKIIDDPQGQNGNGSPVPWSLNVRQNTVTWFRLLERFEPSKRVMAKDLQNRDVFGYYVDKGWMCVQVFFVRQGKTHWTWRQSIPLLQWSGWGLLNLCRTILSRKISSSSNEVLIPQDIDEEAVKVLVDTKILKPQRGEKSN